MREAKPRRVALDLRGLLGVEELFRLTGAVERDPAVEAWLAAEASDLRALARRWFTFLRRCGEDVRERLHDGCPVVCVADAPFGYVNCYRHHVNVGFFRGAMLADPAGLLQGSGKRMRHVKLVPGREPDAQALQTLIRLAYADITACLRGDRPEPPSRPQPPAKPAGN